MPILNMMSWDDVVKTYHERLKDESWYKKTQSVKEETLRWLREEVTIDYKDASNELPKGIVEDLYSCPIANYVHQYYTSEDTHINKWGYEIPKHMVEVAVGDTLRCYQWDSQTQADMFTATYMIPLDVRNFISWFDIGEYPELMDVCDDVEHYAEIQKFLDGTLKDQDAGYYDIDEREESWGEIQWSPQQCSDELKNLITESLTCHKLHITQHDREALAYGQKNVLREIAKNEYNALRENKENA